MYNTHRTIFHGKPGGRSFGGGFGSRRRYFGGGNNGRSTLDVNLFIKKAKEMNLSDEQVVSQTLFSDLEVSDRIKRNITDHGYLRPTPIQEQTIPAILAGRDVIGVANTGTGKTGAFLIPLIEKILKNHNERVLIVTPTRELAMQIVDEMHIFAKGLDLNAVLCIGGANLFSQEKRLSYNPHFVIGTPGRLKDLIRRNRLNLAQFGTIVLDEVDRMVDIGFIRDVQYLISLLPKERQSLFFSATVSGKVRDILHNFVTDPVTVSVKVQETAENIEQDIVKVSDRSKKVEVLHNLLIQEGFDKVLIFGQTKYGIERLTRLLIERGFKAAAIHGNKSQGQRQRALTQFRQNQLQILLATDVASRGLDIDNVTHVINYDTPTSYDDYIHRIGRTGRADKKGTALTFVE